MTDDTRTTTDLDSEDVAEWYMGQHDIEHAALIHATRSIMRVISPENNAELREYAFPLIYEIGRLQQEIDRLRVELAEREAMVRRALDSLKIARKMLARLGAATAPAVKA